MKKIKWLGLSMALVLVCRLGIAESTAPQTPNTPPQPTAPSVPDNLSPGVTEVMRLAESGTTEDVILAYIQNANSSFNLTADQILYLRDNGFSSAVVTAMLNRDNVLRNQPQTFAYDQRLYAPSGQPTVAPVPSVAPVPAEPAVAPASAVPAVQPAPPVPAAETPPPVYVSSPPPEVSYFYNDLSPYGTWVQLEGAGWCWQPRVVVVNRGWRPYCDSGHWVWTDSGWFWQSDYSWGWAPFHYGRWQLHPRCGWVWLPDRVWGPSWVVWRSQGEHCGWAPLPPHSEFVVGVGWRYNGVHVAVDFDFGLHADHFTFIAMSDFHQHDYTHYCMPHTQVTKIYNHTTIINNYVVNNTTIVNKGIRAEQVAAATHTPLKEVHIRDVPAGAPRSTPGRAAEKNDLVVYRPQLKAPAKPVTMVAQKVDDRHPVIQHATIAPGRDEHTSGPGNSAWAPANGNRRPTTETPNTPRPGSEAIRHNASPSASSGQATPPAAKSAEQSKPASRVASAPQAPSTTYGTTAPRVQTEPSAANPHEAPSKNAYPAHAGPQAGQNSGQGRPQSPGEYYPKSYHQAAEAHSLPPSNQQQSDRSSEPGNSHGQSKKNEP
jgi:hypothetical protein